MVEAGAGGGDELERWEKAYNVSADGRAGAIAEHGLD